MIRVCCWRETKTNETIHTFQIRTGFAMLGTGLFAASIWILFLATGDIAYCSEDSDEKSTSSESKPLGHTSVIKNKTSDTNTLSEYQSRKRDKNVMTRVNSDKTSSAEILDANDSQHVELIQETTESSDYLSDSTHSGESFEQKASKASDNSSEHDNGTTETISESFESSRNMDEMNDSSNLDNADTETSDESVGGIAEKSDNSTESDNSDESPDVSQNTDEKSDETLAFDFDQKIAKTSDEVSNFIQSQDDIQTKGNSARKHADGINNEAVVFDEGSMSSDKSSKSLMTSTDPPDSADRRDINDQTIDRSDRSSNHVDVDDDVSDLHWSKTTHEGSKQYDEDNEGQTGSVGSDYSHKATTVDDFKSSTNETESSESIKSGKTNQDAFEAKTKSAWNTLYFNSGSTLDGDSARSSERSKSNRAENRRRRRHQSSNSEFNQTTELSWLNDSESDTEGSTETNEEIGSTEVYIPISHSVQNRQSTVLEQNKSTSSAKTDKTHMPTTVPETTTAFTGASVYATAARSAESKQDQNDDTQNESSSTTTIAAASSAAGVAAVGSTVALIYKLAARLRRAAISSSNISSANGESLDREPSSPRSSSTLSIADNSSMERHGSPISISSRSHLVNHGNSSSGGEK